MGRALQGLAMRVTAAEDLEDVDVELIELEEDDSSPSS
jgi:hypothetical protein